MAAHAAALIRGTMYKGPMTKIVSAAKNVPNLGVMRLDSCRKVPSPFTRARYPKYGRMITESKAPINISHTAVPASFPHCTGNSMIAAPKCIENKAPPITINCFKLSFFSILSLRSQV